ncbi:MAG TPA: hypothetical protein VM511_13510 [Luteolibacter sp.]|nr:hypothetical protein [Luteolibacter sp.]
MSLSAPEDLAMILPIPVKTPADETAVKFIDLSGYPRFFSDLRTGFAAPTPFGGELPATRTPALKVQRVGSYEASFVPAVKDFARLDPRFRLDDKVWKSLPQYEDYGFAVFKFRKGALKSHPMAFSFPSRFNGKIFFPTVHIHDGEVHEKEKFDHELYAQAWQTAVIKGTDWRESEKNAGQFTRPDLSQNLIWGGGHVYQKTIVGEAKNVDIVAEARKLG